MTESPAAQSFAKAKATSPPFDRARLDALLDEAARTSNPETRRLMLEAAERVMLNDYPILPLYFFVSKRLVKPYVQGVRPNPLDRLTSKMLSMSAH